MQILALSVTCGQAETLKARGHEKLPRRIEPGGRS